MCRITTVRYLKCFILNQKNCIVLAENIFEIIFEVCKYKQIDELP